MSGLKAYLAKLKRDLEGLPPRDRRAVMDELGHHLEDRAATLQADGLGKEASMSEAIERFGPAKEVGAALRDVHGRGSWGEAWAATIPFLGSALVVVVHAVMVYVTVLPAHWYLPWLRLGGPEGFLHLVLVTGLGIGLGKGSPRWVYPYVGFLLISTGTLLPSHSALALKVWLGGVSPLLMVGIVLLLTRSWQSLYQPVRGVRHDWTRLSFGLYGVMPIVLAKACVEIRGSHSFPYLIIAPLILAAGALIYVRRARTLQRALSLLIAMTLAWIVTTVGVASYWAGRLDFWMNEWRSWRIEARGMAIAWTVLVALLLAPVLLGLVRRLARESASS